MHLIFIFFKQALFPKFPYTTDTLIIPSIPNIKKIHNYETKYFNIILKEKRRIWAI